MNIHPIFVHFPVALLTLYGFMEVISIRRLQGKPYWFYSKAILVIAGTVSILPTYVTGLFSEDLIGHNSPTRRIVELHEKFAIASTVIFVILALAYLLAWISKNKPLGAATKFHEFILKRGISFSLALLGLVAVTFTGALGGAIAYGPDVDPFMAPILKALFNIQ